MSFRHARFALTLTLCLTPVHLPAASIIYSNISSAFPGKSVTNQLAVSTGFVGTAFTTTGSGNLGTVVTELYRSFGTTPVTVGLYTDHLGAPATLLESWTVPLIPDCCANVPAVVPALTTFTSVAHPPLTAATKYWFVANLGTDDSVFWWFNDEGITGGWWVNNKIAPLHEGADSSPTPGIQLTADEPQPPARVGVLPHIAAGGGWNTVITLVNSSAAAVPVIVSFYDEAGAALSFPVTTTQQGTTQTATSSAVNTTIEPNASLVVSVGGQLPSTLVGWADVDSTVPLGGYAIFRYSPQSGSPEEGTVLLQSQLPSAFTLPYDNTNGFATGVALVNLSTASATITATAWDANGNSLGGESIELDAYGHTSFTLPSEIAKTAGQLGIVTFQSGGTSGSIAGLGLRFSPFNTFTSVPTIIGQ